MWKIIETNIEKNREKNTISSLFFNMDNSKINNSWDLFRYAPSVRIL